MRGRDGTFRELVSDATGQTAVEYTLILVVFGIPMIWLCRVLLAILSEVYRMVTFLETLPYP